MWSSSKEKKIQIDPNEIRRFDYIEAHLPDGSIERGYAVEEVALYSERRKAKRLVLDPTAGFVEWVMVCGYGGHILTDCAGFPDGTLFFKIGKEAI